MNGRVWGSVLAAVAVIGVAQPCAAQQEQSARTYPALFGTGVANTAQSLTFAASLGGGYEGNVAAAATGAPAADAALANAPSSKMATTNGSLTYTLDRKTLSFAAAGAGWANYYPALTGNYIDGGSGSANVSWTPFESTAFSIRQSVASQPIYLVLPVSGTDALNLPVESAPAETSSSALDTELRAETAITLSQKFTKRLSMFVNGGIIQASPLGTDVVPTMSSSDVSAGLSYKITKALAVTVDYFDDEAAFEFNGARTVGKMRGVNGGVDFSKALSLTRKTRLAFAADTGALNQGGKTAFRLNGNVALTREIGRSWTATASYTRDARFDPPFIGFVLSDSVGVSVGGYLSRRLQVSTGAGASRGNIGLSGDGNAFSDGFATTTATYGFTKSLGMSVNYVYSRYDFGPGVTLPTGVARQLSRQSVRVTLEVFLPLFRVLRSPDDVAR